MNKVISFTTIQLLAKMHYRSGNLFGAVGHVALPAEGQQASGRGSRQHQSLWHGKICRRLMERGMPAVMVWVLVHSYQEQVAWGQWGRASCSGTFGIANGTRQGSVASPALWCIYLDPLFAELPTAGVGRVVRWGCQKCWLSATPGSKQEGGAADAAYVQVFHKQEKHTILYRQWPETQQKLSTLCCGTPRSGTPRDSASYTVRSVAAVGGVGKTPRTCTAQGRHSTQDYHEKRGQLIDSSVKIRESFGFVHPADEITAAYGNNQWDQY